MSNLYDLLDQDVIWESKDGKTLLVEQMAPAHIHNLLAWFERRAPAIKSRYDLRFALSGAEPLGPSGDMTCDAFESACDELWETPPLVWLNEQPLIKKLRELQRAYREAEVKIAKARNLVPAGALARIDRTRGDNR